MALGVVGYLGVVGWYSGVTRWGTYWGRVWSDESFLSMTNLMPSAGGVGLYSSFLKLSDIFSFPRLELLLNECGTYYRW